MNKRLLLAMYFFSLFGMMILSAQIQGTIDDTFLPNSGQKGVNGSVLSFAEQNDGKVIIGGSFLSYNQIEKRSLVRINADGSMDLDFNQTNLRTGGSGGGSPEVTSVILQPDGKIIVGGNFEVRTPFPENELLEQDIMRLNADGTRDLNFILDSETGFCGNIRSLAIQEDGKILVVGDISSCLGSTIDNNENIIRLNTDGTLDQTFQVITDGPTGHRINKVLVQPDGKILIAGNFTEVNGIDQFHLSRLNADGSLDTVFSTGTGFNDVVKTMDLQSDGKIIVGGDFTEFNGSTENKLLRLNANGSLDISFSSGDGPGRLQLSNGFVAPRAVEMTALQDDGKLLIGGVFDTYDNQPVARLARLNTDGTVDNTFNIIDNEDITAGVLASLVKSNGDIMVGGAFDNLMQHERSGVTQVNDLGQIDLNFNTTTGPSEGYFDTEISKIKQSTNGKIYVVGRFKEYDDVFSRNIARINMDGSIDTNFSTGIDEFNGFDDEVFDFVELPDGKLVVVGEFENYNGNPAPGIIRLNNDGTIDASFNIGNGVDTAGNNSIEAIVLQADGKLLLGGFFSAFNGFTTRNLCRLNSDGSVDTSFNIGSGPSSRIENIFLLDNGQIFINTFNYNGESMAGRLAKINQDGSRDTSFNATGITTGSTKSLKILDNGQIYVGGFYSSQGSLLRLNADGSLDNTFTTADIINSTSSGTINDFRFQADGKIIIGGRFDEIGGRIIRGVARLNSDGTRDDTFNPEDLNEDSESYSGIDDLISDVLTIELLDSGRLLIGGDFRFYNDMPKVPLLALFAGEPDVLTINDFTKTETFQLFPNPADDKVNIKTADPIKEIQVFDAVGKRIMENQNINAPNFLLNTTKLPNGIYFVQVTTDMAVLTQKLIIK